MRFFFLSTVYPQVENVFSEKVRQQEVTAYDEMKHCFDYGFYLYFDSGFCDELIRRGHEAVYYVYNSESLQRQWALENMKDGLQRSLLEIICEQIKRFSPDLLFFNAVDEKLLLFLKEKFSKIKFWVGWVGSAITKNHQWENLDLIFSCAPETVDFFRNEGLHAIHLNHGFNKKILNSIETPKQVAFHGVSFIGSIFRGEGLHNQRESLLRELRKNLDLKIYSSQESLSFITIAKTFIKKGLFYGIRPFKQYKDLIAIGEKHQLVKKICSWDKAPELPVDPLLSRHFCPGVFGLDMFNTVHSSDIVLNIHADSSPQYASNMRLYETTGVGTCLLTDMRPNLNDLFRIDTEVVAYSSVEDCVEKAIWLLNHPKKMEEIARQGQQRCMKQHTYDNRIGEFIDAISRFTKCR